MNDVNDSLEPPCKRFRLLSQLVVEKQQTEVVNTGMDDNNSDIKEYFSSKQQLQDKNKHDPLNFWTENEKYPKLALLAEDILVTPASSTPIERIFSVAGYSSSGRRNRLAGSNLENEVLIKTNKHYI